MSRKTLKINPYDLFKVVASLENMEKTHSGLDLKSLREQIMAISDFDNSLNSIEVEVKIAILKVSGGDSNHPEKLKNTAKVATDDMSATSLRYEFERIAKKRNPSASISIDEIRDCKTVNDCIKLVISKSKTI